MSLELSKIVAMRLRKTLLDRGMTQMQVARALGITHQTVGAYCSGRKPIINSCLLQICEHLGLDLAEVLRKEEPYQPPLDVQITEYARLGAMVGVRDYLKTFGGLRVGEHVCTNAQREDRTSISQCSCGL